MAGSIENRYCLVTGATSGLGEATARGLAALGAHVILACRDINKGLAVAESIKLTTGNKNIALLEVDLASLASIRRAAREYEQRSHGQLSPSWCCAYRTCSGYKRNVQACA